VDTPEYTDKLSANLPVDEPLKVSVDPGSPAATAFTQAIDRIDTFVIGAPTGVHPDPGSDQVTLVGVVSTSNIVSPTSAADGTVTDFDVDEPDPV